MPTNKNKFKLLDLIDINLLQELQDTFAMVMGVASLVVDDEGPITKPSNFSEFCTNFVNDSETSSKICSECAGEFRNMYVEDEKSLTYNCHVGLTHFTVPIIVDNQHVASIYCGQFAMEKPDEGYLKKFFQKWGIVNQKEYIDALQKIKIHSPEHVKLASELLLVLSETISEIANKNLELINGKVKEKFYIKIIDVIRSSLDINETLSFICEETAKFFNVQRTSISEAPNLEKGGLPIIRMEYKTVLELDDTNKLANVVEIAEFYRKVLLEGNILAVDNILEANVPDYFKENYNLLGIKSILVIPIQKEGDKWGILILSEYNNYRHWNDDDIELANSIASQIYVAIKHAKLYEKEKFTSAKEIALRGTIEILRSTLDTETIKNNFLDVACNYFNADRCIFAEYDRKIGKFLPFRIEVLKKEGVRSLVDVSVEDEFPEFADKLKNKKRNIIIKDLEKTLSRKKLSNYKAVETLRSSDVKSDYGFLVQYQNEILGILILHYVKNKRVFNTEELEFLKILRDQVGVALHQAELYEKAERQAKRESLVREIAERIRRSLNIEETLSFICEETAKLFNVQRTAISSFLQPGNYEIFTVRKEYKYWQDMEGFGFQAAAAKTAAYWAEMLIEGREVLTIDNIEEMDAPEYFKNTYNSMGVKALIGTAIRKGDDVWGTLVLAEYNTYRHWSEEEKLLLKTIADQIYIAINQAELFEKSEKKAQNEKALREIMLTSVQTFNAKKIIKSIVTDTGKLFQADRCFFIEVDNETNTNLPIQDYAEYLSSEDIISHTTRTPSKEETSNFVLRTKEKKYEYSTDVNNSPLPEATKRMLIEDLSVKSYFIAPVFYGDICYGAFVFHYVLNFKQFSQDEIDMALAIASQSAVILHQAELFELTKMQAEREKISKNIIEILRSTLDKSIIRRLFVRNIGKFLNADRVIFSEFNQETQMYDPVCADSEYLSTPDIKSFVGFDWSVPEVQEYIQPILERREFHIYNWHEYTQGNYKSQDFINLFENMNIKSSYSFPVMYQQNVMGFFSIGFVQKVRRLSDDDINRIRNICTQAGIALYHAYMYENAQKSVIEHDKFVNKLSGELKDPLNLIVEFSGMQSEHEVVCAEEVDHLHNINANAKKLLYLLEDITKSISKLNLE